LDTRFRPATAIKKAVKIPPRIYKAYLAEDYDGISQYVLTKLTHGGVSSALKLRVAAGDHSGHTPAPVGTPVKITSINGTTEVLIGQQGRPLQRFIQGAYSGQKVGLAYSGIPALPNEVSAGHLLFALMFASGNTTRFPTQFRFLDDPPTPPASPATPSYPGTAGWTVIETASTDYSHQNIGGPCGFATYQGPFHGGAGVCSSGHLVGAAWRQVYEGEETKYPVAVSTDITDSQVGVYLWEIDTEEVPSGVAVESDGHLPDNVVQLPTITGNCAGLFMYATAVGHGAIANPSAGAALTGDAEEIWQGKAIPGAHAPTGDNDTDYTTPHTLAFGQLFSLPTGGIASASVTPAPGYTGLNWCGLAVEIPEGISLPAIPYPANQIDLGQVD